MCSGLDEGAGDDSNVESNWAKVIDFVWGGEEDVSGSGLGLGVKAFDLNMNIGRTVREASVACDHVSDHVVAGGALETAGGVVGEAELGDVMVAAWAGTGDPDFGYVEAVAEGKCEGLGGEGLSAGGEPVRVLGGVVAGVRVENLVVILEKLHGEIDAALVSGVASG